MSDSFEISVIIYIIIMSLLFVVKPAFIFDNAKVFRQFGLSNKDNKFRKKTLTPLWLLFLVLAIIIYYSVITFHS